jgi:hypothetical protein
VGINYKDIRYYKLLKKFFNKKKIVISNWHNSYKNFDEAIKIIKN